MATNNETTKSAEKAKTIQSSMGLSDYKTTAGRYCHPGDERKRGAVLSVGEMLSKQGVWTRFWTQAARGDF